MTLPVTPPKFVQVHLLTFYPPSNPNRDDANRPKTAQVGGTERLRLSSQSVKRAVRTSQAFEGALGGHLGKRTQRLGDKVLERLKKRGFDHKTAVAHARAIAGVFGKLKGEADDNPQRIEQLAFVSPAEEAAALALADGVSPDAEPVEVAAEALLRRADHAVDVALFGRMFADQPGFNREAAAQISHAFTTHRVAIDDDFYTAVDDLKKPQDEDSGAGFIGDLGFGSGVFYLYACIDRDVLVTNLGSAADGTPVLAAAGIHALVEALATTSPGGKRKAFAHNPRASYLLAEVGPQQPRSLAAAFLRPVSGVDLMEASITALEATCLKLDKGYGPAAEARRVFDVYTPDDRVPGAPQARRVDTLGEVTAFCAEGA